MSDLSKGDNLNVAASAVDATVLVPPPDRKARHQREAEGDQKPRRKHFLVAFFGSRRLHALLIISALIYLFIWIPHFLWERSPVIPLNLLVIDKTVPFQDYREHRGLFWLLINNKFIDPASQKDNALYDPSMDYNGFYPYSDEQILATEDEEDALFGHEFNPHFVGPVPPEKQVEKINWRYNEIKAEDLADRDVLYICDTYGVYSADYWQFKGDIAHTIHSAKIYGGMSDSEVSAIEQFVENGNTVIAEFNTLASPTGEEERQRLENIFGVDWTNWIGRYFVDFGDETDVPWWLYELYEQQHGRDWDLTGSGYLFCQNESSNFFVLTDKEDVAKGGMLFVPRKDYMENDVLQGCYPSTFTYWFDVVTVQPDPTVQILADFEFKVTESGRRKMVDNKLPLVIPAIIRKQSYYNSYYMCGEMTEFGKAMGPPDTRLTLHINRSFYGREVQGSTGFPFWHSSYPLVTNILRKEADLQQPLKVPVYPFR
jgi:hypothetical protein